MVETPDFLQSRPVSVPIRELLHRHPIAVLLAFGASIVSNASYYLLLYIPTYGVKTAAPARIDRLYRDPGGRGHPRGLFADCRALVGQGRAPRIMLVMGWLFFLTAYPVFYLMVAYPSLAIGDIRRRLAQPRQGRI